MGDPFTPSTSVPLCGTGHASGPTASASRLATALWWQTQAGGDQNGANLRLASYTANNLNQITSRDVPGYADVMGASISTNAVTVNSQTAYRNQEYFRQQIGVTNVVKPVWTNITVAGGSTVSGNVFVTKTPEQLSYDADGNLTNDGRWSYVWDGENRLIQMSVNTNVGPQYQLKFAYDSQGRRIQKMVSTNSVGIYTNNFLYDGWNLIATFNSPSSILASYVWGTDLSGSIRGAGGIGGLLEISHYGTSITNCFPVFDGNGNVMALANTADGTLTADYDYGPFGEPIRIDGPMGTVNPLRFSTKYDDDESDLVYYGYRYYKLSIGTWLVRDPLNATSGTEARLRVLQLSNLDNDLVNSIAGGPITPSDYIFVNNNPIMGWDLFGFCDADSGPGQNQGSSLRILEHKVFKYFGVEGATLTFKVCCPFGKAVDSFTQESPLPAPPPTLNGNTFPYSVVTNDGYGPLGNGVGNCLIVTLRVPSTTATEYLLNQSPGNTFIPSIHICAKCVCDPSVEAPNPLPF